MSPATKTLLERGLLALLIPALMGAVAIGVAKNRLDLKADAADVNALRIENNAAHDRITNALNTKLDRIESGVEALRSIACSQNPKDSYCRGR